MARFSGLTSYEMLHKLSVLYYWCEAKDLSQSLSLCPSLASQVSPREGKKKERERENNIIVKAFLDTLAKSKENNIYVLSQM